MQHGAAIDADLAQLWRRIVFNICVRNTDDHLRNHGFLLTSSGWILSPAYDLNPVPTGTGLSLNISDTDNALDLRVALDVISFFRLSEPKAQAIIEEVRAAVSTWRSVAQTLKISRDEQSMMEAAFDL